MFIYNQKISPEKEAGPLESWERGNNQSSLITVPLKHNKNLSHDLYLVKYYLIYQNS